jgi:hypothetical protein
MPKKKVARKKKRKPVADRLEAMVASCDADLAKLPEWELSAYEGIGDKGIYVVLTAKLPTRTVHGARLRVIGRVMWAEKRLGLKRGDFVLCQVSTFDWADRKTRMGTKECMFVYTDELVARIKGRRLPRTSSNPSDAKKRAANKRRALVRAAIAQSKTLRAR